MVLGLGDAILSRKVSSEQHAKPKGHRDTSDSVVKSLEEQDRQVAVTSIELVEQQDRLGTGNSGVRSFHEAPAELIGACVVPVGEVRLRQGDRSTVAGGGIVVGREPQSVSTKLRSCTERAARTCLLRS